MGRINLTPLRVRQRALANLESRPGRRPVWLNVVGDIPPAQIFVRQQPIQHPLTKIRTRSIPPPPDAPPLQEGQTLPTRTEAEAAQPKRRRKKASQLFQPVQIRYEEDELRKTFFSDHPWELARPRVVLERDGKDAERLDWSRGLQQPGRPTNGEDVVQRQLHLLQTVPDITVSQAYDKARKEFYDIRRQEDIQRRVAAEEAEAMGANFGPTILQWSMQIENKQYDDWEEWSKKVVIENMQRNAAFAGETTNVEEEMLDAETDADSSPGSSVFASEQVRQAAQGRREGVIA